MILLVIKLVSVAFLAVLLLALSGTNARLTAASKCVFRLTTVLVVVFTIASFFNIDWKSWPSYRGVSLSQGSVAVFWGQVTRRQPTTGIHVYGFSSLEFTPMLPEVRITPMTKSGLVTIPLWIVFLAALSGWIYTGYLEKRRTMELHQCPSCKYDLRGSTDTCPECGHTMEAAK